MDPGDQECFLVGQPARGRFGARASALTYKVIGFDPEIGRTVS